MYKDPNKRALLLILKLKFTRKVDNKVFVVILNVSVGLKFQATDYSCTISKLYRFGSVKRYTNVPLAHFFSLKL